MVDRGQLVRRRIAPSEHEELGAAVAPIVQENTAGWLPVAPTSSRLLVIGFERSWKIVVNDESYVGPIDAQSKRVGGHDRLQLSGHEAVLRFLAPPGAQPAVIGQDLEPFAL
jgi:hypothetical protein